MTLSYLYKVQICHHCGKEGHIQRVCPSKQQVKLQQATKTPDVRPVEVEVDAYEDILGTLEVRNVRKQSNDIVWVDLDVDGTHHSWLATTTNSGTRILKCTAVQMDFLGYHLKPKKEQKKSCMQGMFSI